MRTVFFALLLAISFPMAGIAQPTVDRNAVYFELGGNGLFASVNYDRRITDRFLARVGFSYVVGEESDGDDDVTIIVPLMAGYLSHPRSNHHLETGAGITLITGDAQDFEPYDGDEQISNTVATGTVAYRYQKPGGVFVFRAGLTPLLIEGELLPWLGVSFGGSW